MARHNYSSDEARKRIVRELARISAELDVLEAELHVLWVEECAAEVNSSEDSRDRGDT